MAPGMSTHTNPHASCRTPSPLSLFRQAVKLVKQQQPLCADVSADSLIEQKLQQSIRALGNSVKDSDTGVLAIITSLVQLFPSQMAISGHGLEH